MIKLLKKIIEFPKSIIIYNIYSKTEKLIEKRDYKQAGQELLSAVKLSEKVVNLKTYNLYKIYIFFLSCNYEICISLLEKALASIENSKTSNKDTKNYQKKFVYMLVYISYLVLEKKDNIENMKKIIREIDFEINNVTSYIIERYPIYNMKKLLDDFSQNGYPESITMEKLEEIYLELEEFD